MRYLMRLNVEKGTATRADVKGYYVGGKTGTSEKVVGGRYSKTKVLTTFTAVLPADRAALCASDHARRAAADSRKRTASPPRAGTRCRSAARSSAAIAPLLGLEPRFDLAPSDKLIWPARRGGDLSRGQRS